MRAAFDAYAKSLEASGVLLSADILQPPSNSTTVTRRTGALQVQDGPFANAKEQLAGSFVVEVADLAAAIAWAGKCPGADYGTIEVRAAEAFEREISITTDTRHRAYLRQRAALLR